MTTEAKLIPTIPIPALNLAQRARFEAKYEVAESGCWLWTDRLDKGYGQFSINGRNYKAHRVAYALYKGPIPEGMTIDHVCRVRSCVNADHLEVVTNRENVLRGDGLTAQESRQTHCLRGHEFNEENTSIQRRAGTDHRGCRACAQMRERKRGPRHRNRSDASC